MPAGDRPGLRGMDPISGKATGYCGEQQAAGYVCRGNNSGRRLGGYGKGFGKGRGRRFHGGITGIPGVVPTATREQELETLKQQAEYFKTAGEEISARIKEIETPATGE